MVSFSATIIGINYCSYYMLLNTGIAQVRCMLSMILEGKLHRNDDLSFPSF